MNSFNHLLAVNDQSEIRSTLKRASACFVFQPAALATGFLFALASIAFAAPKIETVSSLHKLTAKERGVLEPFQSTPIHLRTARGEWESFQIVVAAGNEELKNVTAQATQLVSDNGVLAPQNVELYWENFVFVENPSGNKRLEKLWWPDALIPLSLQKEKTIAAGRNEVLWCAVRVPGDAKPGEYTGVINVYADGRATPVIYRLTVENVTMPAPTLRGNVAVYYELLRDWYAKNLNAPFDENLKKQYYEFLLDYRINAYDLPVAWDDPQAAKYLNDPRVLSVRLPPLDQKEQFATALRVLRENNALGKVYYYWIDEPSPDDYARVRQTTKQLHAIDSQLKHCVTVHPNQSLQSAVDIWCPNIGDHFGLGHLDASMLATERKKGNETWWYTMVEPKYPYPTWLLDDDALSVRIYGALMATYGIKGFVYSMAHGWGPKPLENLQSYAGTNGDGTLLYPAELAGGVGPMPSIRLMLLRDAIEDYELVKNLDQGMRENVLQELFPYELPYLPINLQFQAFRDSLRTGHQFRVERPDFSKIPPTFQPSFYIKDVLQSPVINGQINEVAWNDQTFFTDNFHLPDIQTKDFTKLWSAKKQSSLYVAFRAQGDSLEKEWCAIEIAPKDAIERYRFVVTAKGNGVVEKHTREGRFRIEGLDWKYAVKQTENGYDVEMQIPLSVVNHQKTFRFNALRRIGGSTPVIVRAFPDAGDVTLMPLATLQ